MLNSIDRAKMAFGLGALIWTAGWAFTVAFPQLPDGDSTARGQFLAWYGSGWQHQIRQGWWWNLSGAVMAWGAIAKGMEGKVISALYAVWLIPLLVWGYGQTLGWQGELFLAPGVTTRLSDSQTTIVFERFILPPAPDGAGRALRMRMLVNGQSYDVSEAEPFRGDGWTVRPRWYGAIVTHPLLDEPFYAGATGNYVLRLQDGRDVPAAIDVERLTVSSEPQLPGWGVTHYAVVSARYPY